MNVKELIEKIEALPTEDYKYSPWIDKKLVLGLVKQLDEPEKITIPQFVADWIKLSKNIGRSLFGAMSVFEKENDVKKWMQWADNQETFALAWIFGYEVEKEKRYLVKIKNGQPLVKAPLGKNFYFNQNITAGNYKATRKELEEANFGWVFDCEGIEIEEVENGLR